MVNFLCFTIFNLVLTFFISAVLAYTSVAISIGPWASPLVILCCNFLLFKKFLANNNPEEKRFILFKLQVWPTFAGIIATAIGFNLPTLFFLNKEEFYRLISLTNLQSYCVLGIILTLASIWGALSAKTIYLMMSKKKDVYPYPIPTLFSDILNKLNQNLGAILMHGSLATILAQLSKNLVKGQFYQLKNYFDFFPGLGVVGFLIGPKAILPFSAGIFIRTICLPGVVLGLPKLISSYDSNVESCVHGVLGGMLLFDVIGSLFQTMKKLIFYQLNQDNDDDVGFLTTLLNNQSKTLFFIQGAVLATTTVLLNFFYHLSMLNIVFLMGSTFFICRRLIFFLAQTGLAPFGRLVSLFMFPQIFLFGYTNFVLVALCLFVSVAGASAVATVISEKFAEQINFSKTKTFKLSLTGAIVTPIISLIVFLFFFNYFKLGSTIFFAQRGLARSILINSVQTLSGISSLVNIIIGIALSLLFQIIGIGAESVIFSALTMPITMNLSMFAGILLSRFIKKTQNSEVFASGVFVGDFVFVIASMIFNLTQR